MDHANAPGLRRIDALVDVLVLVIVTGAAIVTGAVIAIAVAIAVVNGSAIAPPDAVHPGDRGGEDSSIGEAGGFALRGRDHGRLPGRVGLCRVGRYGAIDGAMGRCRDTARDTGEGVQMFHCPHRPVRYMMQREQCLKKIMACCRWRAVAGSLS